MFAHTAVTLALIASVTPATAKLVTMTVYHEAVTQLSAGSDGSWCPTGESAWMSNASPRFDGTVPGRGVFVPNLTGTWAMRTGDGRQFAVTFAQNGTSFAGHGVLLAARFVMTGTMSGEAGTAYGEYLHRGTATQKWTARLKLFGGGDAMTWSVLDGETTCVTNIITGTRVARPNSGELKWHDIVQRPLAAQFNEEHDR